MALNTLDIIEFMRPIQKDKIFKGVFPCDGLPSSVELPAGFIINLSSSSQPGSHWVALYIDDGGTAVYFDSFGLAPKNSFIKKFIKLHSKMCIYSSVQLQHISSVKCGKFAAIFVAAKLQNKHFINFLNKFSKNLTINDIVVDQIYKYLQKK